MKCNKTIAGTVFLMGFILLGFSANTFGGQLDTYLNNLYDSHVMPGFSVVVVKNNQVVFKKGYGFEYSDKVDPYTASTVSAIGSLTKSLTSLAVLQLVERGSLDLDDPVVDHLPWFRTANKLLSDKITVRMLLNNTSGLRAPVVRNRDISDSATEYLVKSMESVYLTAEPGTSYEYSNDGFALAGLLVSHVAGMSWESYMDKYIFTPLEMNRTTNDPQQFKALSALYGHHSGIEKAIPVYDEEDFLKEYEAAGSLLRSSAIDIGHYLMALLNGGIYNGKKVISHESIQKMWTSSASFPGISDKDGGNNLPFFYGMGWFSAELDGKDYIFHGGSRRSMSSMTFICPEENIGIALLSNLDLTHIDRYHYPNLINIANNIVRISMDQTISDFAIPRIADPTENDYILPAEEEDQYTGTYLLSAGNDWVYLGSELKINKGIHGLEGVISKGDQVIEKFYIDFITRKTAVSRNLTMPGNIHFKFSGGGAISDVIISGKKYSRLSEGYYSKLREIASSDNSIRFYYPKSWNIGWAGVDFTGHSGSESNQTIIGMEFMESQEPDQYFAKLFPGFQILHRGERLSEISGSQTWNEMAFVSSKGENQYQHYLCFTRNENRIYVIALTSPQNLTDGMRQVIPTLLSTFSWNL